MASAKMVSLSVRASQSSVLCFETNGILGELNAELGEQVPPMDFAAFYATLGALPTMPGHPARLLYNFLEIQNFVQKFTLAALRAEASKANLSKAINTRANAYYAKYANAPGIIAKMNELFSPSVADSKPNRLQILAQFSEDQMSQLRNEYHKDGREGVIKLTDSWLFSTLTSSGNSSESGQMNDEMVGMTSQRFTFPPLKPDGGVLATGAHGDAHSPSRDPVETLQQGTSSQTASSEGIALQRERIINRDYGYRIPHLENLAQYERAQISLIDEQFSQFMYGQSLPYLAAIFANELQAIDSSVYQLQVAYLNTILMSPIKGLVTGIYKHAGDAVQAGEPVVRVENTDDIFLSGTIVYPGLISVGSTLSVTAPLFDAGGPAKTVSGRVVAVRGLNDDEQWDVTVKCNNLDASGVPILPLGYQFDFDDSTLSIT